MHDFEEFELWRTDEAIRVNSHGANQDAALQMVNQSERSTDIISPELDSPLFDTPEVAETVKQLILSNRHVKIRILVN